VRAKPAHRRPHPLSRRLGALCLAILGVVTSAACGSRLDRGQLEATGGALQVAGATSPALDRLPTPRFDPAANSGDTTPVTSDGQPLTDAPLDRGAGTATTTRRSTAADAAHPAPGASPGNPAPATGSVPDGAPSNPSPARGTTPGAVNPVPTRPVGRGSEIVVGSFGAESGILGAVTGPAPPALRAWAAAVNAAGGVNGHPVRLVMADDNADPARTQQIVRQMVERDKVIAFLNEYSFTLEAVTGYLEQRQVPIIGSIGAEPIADHSPIVFHPLVGADTGQAWGFLLTVAAQTDHKHLGLIYCRETVACGVQAQSIKHLLPWDGLTVVYEAQVSLAQPDYTAEMLQAQRAGAEVLISLVDTASLGRMAESAHRQGYRPTYAGTYNLNQDLVFSFADQLEGLLLTSRSAPWDTSPKLAAYRDAMSRYQPKAPQGDMGSGAFIAGQLFAERIGPFIGEPPTSGQVLDGLYSLKQERLGGLLPGVAFEHGEHSRTNQCVVPTRLTRGRFLAHDGAAESFVCAPGWKPVGS
jgi:branched-chain amino acid transport system substrate-binding protein